MLTHQLLLSPELVQRRFTPKVPNQLWRGDTTYISTDKDWQYLAAVLGPAQSSVVVLELATQHADQSAQGRAVDGSGQKRGMTTKANHSEVQGPPRSEIIAHCAHIETRTMP